jgi:hypothetical protein
MINAELIEKIAKSINGPFHPVSEHLPYTLDQLREIRWTQINEAERKLCLAQARAATITMLAIIREPDFKKSSLYYSPTPNSETIV